MEISLSRYHSIVYDQLPNSSSSSFFPFTFSDPKFSRKLSFFSGFPSIRRKWRNPFHLVKCSSTEHEQKPRLKPKPSKIELNHITEPLAEQIQIKRPSSGICFQIEKLVLGKRYREALELFEILEIEGGFDINSSTFDSLISACIGLKSIRGVKRVFNYMTSIGFEADLYMNNRVLLMHVKCGMMIDALKLFDEMLERNLVSWNTIISGTVDSGNYIDAFRLFSLLWEESSDVGSRTFATMIRASSGLEVISVGKQLHTCALKIGLREDIFISCSLIDMYSKCGSIEDARFVFDEMPEKSTVGWNSIIAGYALHGFTEQALDLYYEMRESRVKMDHFTFSILIRISTRLASLEHAKQAHAGLVRNGFGLDIVANTALVDFYSKWGRIDDARQVFDKMPCKNLISWNALISGYGKHGRGEEAIAVFEEMVEEGLKPNHITFLAILSACSYSGLSQIGWEIFRSMSSDYKIKPRAMHYACMIELLGREGVLDEAFALIKNSPFRPSANMWGALLTACRVHGNLELGKFAAEKLYGMEPEKLSNYIVLLNLYNKSGNLKEAGFVLNTLKRKGLRMLPACSWIEVKKQPSVFLSGEKNGTGMKEVYEKVDELMFEISKNGFSPGRKALLPDVDEEEEEMVLYHSEKLAIAFGILNTLNQSSLQIVQSHRMCGDCHEAIKLIALVTRREIVVRDASRFHHFQHGSCSCGDYW